MKKLLLSLMLLAFVTAPAMAYVQNNGHLSNTGSRTDAPNPSGSPNTDDNLGATGHDTQPLGRPKPPGGDGDEKPTRPVPEPGTMALTSMGLLALGAAARKRRGN